MTRALLLLAVFGFAACGNEGPLMSPGKNCLDCHHFSAAGTVYTASGGPADAVTVTVGGVTMTSNAAGNFFTSTPITFPALVQLESNGKITDMPLAPNGACNGCHGGSTSRITAQ